MVLACVLVAGGPRAAPAGARALLVPRRCRSASIALALVLYSESLTLQRRLRLPRPRPRPRLATVVTTGSTRSSGSLNKLLIYGAAAPGVAFLLRGGRSRSALALAGVLVVAGFVDARNNERDPPGAELLRRAPGHARPRRQGLHGAAPRHDAARPAEPMTRSGAASRCPTTTARARSASSSPSSQRRAPSLRIAVIGLGTGTLAAYARPGDAMTFYEIDRLVRDIAFDRAYFTYVTDAARTRRQPCAWSWAMRACASSAVKRERPGERYDLIVVDAFTSDAIPVHLLTREALQLYLDMLAPGGVLALHISNRYLDLEPVVANLAEDAGARRPAARARRIRGDRGRHPIHVGGAGPDGRGARRPRRRTSAGPRRGSRSIRASACGPTTSTTCCRSSSGDAGESRRRARRISRAAFQPGAPMTPPPGWAAAPQR